MKLSVNNQSECPESRALNARIWAFVSSVGANSTPDIGESIFSDICENVSVGVGNNNDGFTNLVKFLHSLSKSLAAQSILPRTSCSTGYTQALR